MECETRRDESSRTYSMVRNRNVSKALGRSQLASNSVTAQHMDSLSHSEYWKYIL